MNQMEGARSDHGRTRPGSVAEVFLAFLKLGLTSFGGPIAHLGYFRDEFVLRRRWLDEHAYADLVGMCQFLPGPTSSQVGFSIGLLRAGYRGALGAWVGFTFPSAAAMLAVAYGVSVLEGPVVSGLLHGLKLVAVAIVAQAVWGMARTLCPDGRRASIAIVTAAISLFLSSSLTQLAVILLGGILGWVFCRNTLPPSSTVRFPVLASRKVGMISLTIFFVLLAGLPLLRVFSASPEVALMEAFYRSGALVFGGGHVVLPMLREAFVGPGWITDDAFLAGYGAAQAVPGPLFTFASYLGALAAPTTSSLAGATWGLIGIFLPGMLILLGTRPLWDSFRGHPKASAVMAGVNAAVVGLLAAALYNPVWTTSVRTLADMVFAAIGFVLLTFWRVAPFLVVLLTALGAVAVVMLG